MNVAQIIENGVVVNVIAVDPSAIVSSDGSKLTWAGGEFDAPAGATLMMQPGAGIGWTLSSGALVAPSEPAAQPPTTAILQAYAGGKVTPLLARMRTYGTSPVLKSDATTGTLSNLLALIQWGSSNPTATQNWVANDYSVTAITGAEFAAVAPLVGAYAQSVYAALATVLGEIASATITTTAQIDAYAWPA